MKELIKKLYFDKRIRFLFVGCLNTIVGYGTFALFTFWGFHYAIAQTMNYTVGTIHSYFWNKYFTFSQKKRNFKELLKFILVCGVILALSILLQYLLIDICGLNQYVGGLISIFFTTILSYFGHNFFSFNNKEQQ